MKNIFGTTIKQTNDNLWIVKVLDRNRKVLKEKLFDTYKQAKNFMDSMTV